MESRAVCIVNIFQKSGCPLKKCHMRFSFSPSVHFINGVGHTSNIKVNMNPYVDSVHVASRVSNNCCNDACVN